MNAARYDKKKVQMVDFEFAKDKVLMGAERKSMVLTEEEKRVTAYHEGGHALVAAFLPRHDPPGPQLLQEGVLRGATGGGGHAVPGPREEGHRDAAHAAGRADVARLELHLLRGRLTAGILSRKQAFYDSVRQLHDRNGQA